MSTPALIRLPLNRMFFATLMSNVVTRSPNFSLFNISGTDHVVELNSTFELRKQPTPLDGIAQGAVARAGLFQVTWSLLTVQFALISGPGNDWNTRLTSTSAFGIVYVAVPLTVVWNGLRRSEEHTSELQ